MDKIEDIKKDQNKINLKQKNNNQIDLLIFYLYKSIYITTTNQNGIALQIL